MTAKTLAQLRREIETYLENVEYGPYTASCEIVAMVQEMLRDLYDKDYC